jgi:cupin fold WbuC family metalloprotein
MPSVMFATGDIVQAGDELIEELVREAREAPLKRARFCLHHSPDDSLHEMVIALLRESYVRPHRHVGKTESFHVIAGTLQIVLFEDDGRVAKRISMGPRGSGRPFLYRLSGAAWHTVIVEDEWVVFHEVTNGPFRPEDTDYAAWAPLDTDPEQVDRFVGALRNPVGGSPPANRTTLTVILCNYNHGRYVPRAIQAVLSQSRQPDEFIIIDDGSTDDSPEVIGRFAANHPCIKFVRQDRNCGFHESFRRALELATGDYVYSGASDDYVLPGFFEQIMELAAQHTEAGVLSGQIVCVDAAGRRLSVSGLDRFDRPVFIGPADYLRECLQVDPPHGSLSPATIYRREVLQQVGGFRRELDFWADTFAIRAAGLRFGFCYLPRECVVWTTMEHGISESARQDPRRLFDVLNHAARLMRSEAFRTTFPAEYVTQWERAFRECMADAFLGDAMRGYQQVQSAVRRTATLASPGQRLVLGMLRRLMTAAYLGCFRWTRRVLLGWRPASNQGSDDRQT